VIRRELLTLPILLLGLTVSAPTSAQTTFNVSNNGITSYTIDQMTNPTLNLERGQTYFFQVNAIGHPFWIKTVQGTGTANAYNDGVTNNGIQSGTITFVVPGNAPALLFYNCEFHGSMTGRINVSGPVGVEPVTWGKLKATFVEMLRILGM
jgi:hypothetical protein